MSCSYYLQKCFIQRERDIALQEAEEQLKDLDYDSIVVRGLSGTIMGSCLAHRLKKNLVVVRKGEECHGYSLEYNDFPKKYIILDDLVSSGDTIRSIKDRMDRILDSISSRCMGIYLYHSNRDSKSDSFQIDGESYPYLNRAKKELDYHEI